MEFYTSLTVFGVLFLAFAGQADAGQTDRRMYAVSCKRNEYVDQNVHRCEPCSSICHQHRLKGTTKSCKKHCPVVYGDLECPDKEYYDVNVDNCDSCSIVCDDHKLQGTTEDCKKYCPNDYEGRKNNSGENGKKGPNYALAVGLSAVLVLVILAPVVVVRFWKRSKKSKKTPIQSTNYRMPDVRLHMPETCCNEPCTSSITCSQDSNLSNLEEQPLTASQGEGYPELPPGRN